MWNCYLVYESVHQCSFNKKSQTESVLQSLLTLVNMILNGSNIKDQSSNSKMGQPVLTLAQLLVFNAVRRRRDMKKSTLVFHRPERETPVPVFVGLKESLCSYSQTTAHYEIRAKRYSQQKVKGRSFQWWGINEEWCAERKAENPQFLYWFTCLELELLVLSFLRSLRTGNFEMYLNCITKLAPWFFTLNHNSYARWLSVHIKDMCSLEAAHPEVLREFKNGKFVMNKSTRLFSSIAIDQGHEQNNATMKKWWRYCWTDPRPWLTFTLGFGWSWNHSHHIWIWIFNHRERGDIREHQTSWANAGTSKTTRRSSQVSSSSDKISRESLRGGHKGSHSTAHPWNYGWNFSWMYYYHTGTRSGTI